MITVTKPFLPDVEEFKKYVEQIWDNKMFTNGGPFVTKLESELAKIFGNENTICVTNGTIAIQVALLAFGITEGEIITTPFSYVATTSSILLEKLTPVFVDIDEDTLCIDANKIEEKITENTKAILAVHVFGIPCDIQAIEKIAKKHNIKVIYDAAHAFNAKYLNKSLLDYGDASTCSFHATKLYHTGEGGCIVFEDNDIFEKGELIRRFGHNGNDHLMLGTNAKMSELHASLGVLNLNYIDMIHSKRKEIYDTYFSNLNGVLKFQKQPKGYESNYAYVPVIFKSESELLKVEKALNENDIFPRRYFYPSLDSITYVNQTEPLPISAAISKSIMCLPLYVDLPKEDVIKICEIIKENL